MFAYLGDKVNSLFGKSPEAKADGSQNDITETSSPLRSSPPIAENVDNAENTRGKDMFPKQDEGIEQFSHILHNVDKISTDSTGSFELVGRHEEGVEGKRKIEGEILPLPLPEETLLNLENRKDNEDNDSLIESEVESVDEHLKTVGSIHSLTDDYFGETGKMKSENWDNRKDEKDIRIETILKDPVNCKIIPDTKDSENDDKKDGGVKFKQVDEGRRSGVNATLIESGLPAYNSSNRLEKRRPPPLPLPLPDSYTHNGKTSLNLPTSAKNLPR